MGEASMGVAMNRREFVRAGTLAAACALAPVELSAAASAPLTPAEFKEKLRGPIVSIPTPFTADSRIDEAGLRRMIATNLQHDITIFELTAGDSQYSYLAYDEIKQLARMVVDDAGEQGITIIGTGAWWTDRAIDFARYVESIGGTAVQVLKPGADDKDVVEHYRAIANAVRLPIVLHGNFAMPLLEELVKIESIVALKEDVSMEYYVNGEIRFGKRINCFSGGGLDWYMVAQPYGARAYFDSYATFAPEITVRFREAAMRNDYAAEREIIENYDHPFIVNFSAPFWHATMEYFGVASRYLRAPQHSYTDAEMAKVKSFYNKLGLQPKRKGA
jgi:dihydrodipicolinate synthase/N-acetylneuraminate lyase